MENPLVSVICLCFNHREFVVEAMNSVLAQTYENIELIVVDDASTDGSQQVINEFCKEHPEVKKLLLENNQGNCRAFNQGWVQATGKYIIDLAADDLLHKDRVVKGVEMFEELGAQYGIHFTDARLIDRQGASVGLHITSEYYNPVPQGIIFKELLSRYFINPVSMMMSGRMLKLLGGYDEALAYEDFDLWVRSAKEFSYCYTPEVLVSKRILQQSHGSKQYKTGSEQLRTTYLVCHKAFDRCMVKDDFMALLTRVNYEMKQAVLSLNLKTARDLFALRRETKRRLTELS